MQFRTLLALFVAGLVAALGFLRNQDIQRSKLGISPGLRAAVDRDSKIDQRIDSATHTAVSSVSEVPSKETAGVSSEAELPNEIIGTPPTNEVIATTALVPEAVQPEIRLAEAKDREPADDGSSHPLGSEDVAISQHTDAASAGGQFEQDPITFMLSAVAQPVELDDTLNDPNNAQRPAPAEETQTVGAQLSGIQLGALDSQSPPPFLGVRPYKQRPRLTLGAVRPNSPADRAGLMVGDVLLSIDRQPTSNIGVLRSVLSRHQTGDMIVLDVDRGGNRLQLPLTLSQD